MNYVINNNTEVSGAVSRGHYFLLAKPTLLVTLRLHFLTNSRALEYYDKVSQLFEITSARCGCGAGGAIIG